MSPAARMVKFHLTRKGLTHAKLAEMLRVSTSTVSKVCRDHSDSPIIRQKIEDYFGVAFWSSEVEFRRRNGKPSGVIDLENGEQSL